MRKFYSIILSALLLMTVALPGIAQDERQRKPETIVQDVLAQVPVQKQADYNREMEDLAKGAPATVEILCKMLKPVEKAVNNKVEYAISGVVNYACANNKYKAAVRQGLEASVASAPDAATKQFLQEYVRFIKDGRAEIPAYKNHAGAEPYAKLWDELKAAGANCAPIVIKALKSDDRALRMQALKFANNYADAAFVGQVAQKYNSLSTEAKNDVLGWIGDNKTITQLDLVIKEIQKGKGTNAMAIETAGRLGTATSVDALIAALSTDYKAEATAALLAFNGNINERVTTALKTATGDLQLALLDIANTRRIKSASPQVFELINSSDATVAAAALKALPGVVTKDNATQLAGMMDKASGEKAAIYQQAFTASIKGMNAEEQYKVISSEIQKASNKARFYPALAATNTDQSVADLQAAWQGGSTEALAALQKSSNYKAAAPLLAAAQKGDETSLKTYIKLINANEGVTKRVRLLDQALPFAKSADAKKAIINSLGNAANRYSFDLAAKYLDDKEVNYQAAAACKNIASKCKGDIDYKKLTAGLNKASEIYKAHGGADDGYAVDEIKKILAEVKPGEIYKLTDEEKKEGFEILFDGTNLDKWTGDKKGYQVINNEIVVSAQYGSSGNLYSAEEYKDFVLRFDFCFTRPGVNNGIGIRTPMGVDAAYHGMCESQILDHDDPIYGGLAPYQVHGSVYGVIPAKRIKHKPLGQWSTEEIRVKGDHITVTVNGEVIVDGNVREACKGHNVAPDGGNSNPYTADHRNHPGMFNKQGHIGFLGHGEGMKYRNVRILDMSKGKKGKK
ncbi:MAG: DUF1080 domain-containing protein [Bacteroidaceae bacterium]|nr:DUF1080 domain-containing protein [Bacteroidaceae bacterium]